MATSSLLLPAKFSLILNEGEMNDSGRLSTFVNMKAKTNEVNRHGYLLKLTTAFALLGFYYPDDFPEFRFPVFYLYQVHSISYGRVR